MYSYDTIIEQIITNNENSKLSDLFLYRGLLTCSIFINEYCEIIIFHKNQLECENKTFKNVLHKLKEIDFHLQNLLLRVTFIGHFQI